MKRLGIALGIFLVCGAFSATQAQPGTLTLRVIDAKGSEVDNDPAVLIVRRSKGIRTPLRVHYRLAGAAQNGADYELLQSSVLIPPGSYTARIPIVPIDDYAREGTERVKVSLKAPTGRTALNYRLGPINQAAVQILDDDLGKVPTLNLTFATANQVFTAPARVRIYTSGSWLELFQTVECFEGSNSLGIVTNQYTGNPRTLLPFNWTWENVPVGTYTITAKGTTAEGQEIWAAPIIAQVFPAPENQLSLLPAVTGTVAHWLDWGIYGMPVGNDLQATYRRTTDENRQFRRAFLEFQLPELTNAVESATLVLRVSGSNIGSPYPDDTYELSHYSADLIVDHSDYDQSTTPITLFGTDESIHEQLFEFDVTAAVLAGTGPNLGFRVKLTVDPEFIGFNWMGIGFMGIYSEPFEPRLIIKTQPPP